ncbi:MAG: hypothetical protein ABIQ60_07420 [Burkholderiaceae bacterium]
MQHERGIALLEALIAFLVLSLGILTIGRVQSHLRLGSDISRQRSEAVRLGQEDLEMLRAFSVVPASAGTRSYADINPAVVTIDPPSGYATNTRYRLTRAVLPSSAAAYKQASVSVVWADRGGIDQSIVLDSIIAGHDPSYATALGFVPAGTPVKGVYGRSSWIPLAAKNFGDGRSAFKPVTAGALVHVFDNATGRVTESCLALDPAVSNRTLTRAALSGCTPGPGLLLSGTIRFSSAAPPDPGQATDTPLGLAVAVAPSGGTYPAPPHCDSEALKTIRYVSVGETRVEAVPIAATPASIGLATWTDSGDRYVAFHCVVYPLASSLWSGRATLLPLGWTIGTGASDRRVCRYAADQDGSGAIDTNIEHPADYQAVSTPLGHQNFLVVGGVQTCPPGTPIQISGTANDVYRDLSTVQHQP